MSFLGALFSSKKAVDTALDIGKNTAENIISGIDHIFYGDQEKAEFSINVGKQVLEFVQATLSESTMRSMARRIIAVLITAQAMLLTEIALVLILLREDSLFKQVLQILEIWWKPFLAVVIFYFGYYGFMKIFGKSK